MLFCAYYLQSWCFVALHTVNYYVVCFLNDNSSFPKGTRKEIPTKNISGWKWVCEVKKCWILCPSGLKAPAIHSLSIPQENSHYSLPLRLTASVSITLKHCSFSQKHFHPVGEWGQLSRCQVTPFSPLKGFRIDMVFFPFFSWTLQGQM